ncbi:SAF-like family protein [Bordetella holmesii 70147]|nr:SAF-like family protein [Bordetella holmesii 70147]
MQAHIESKERDLQRRNQVPTVARVVAWADLPAGHVLQVEDLAQRDIPTAWASVQSLGPDDLEDVIGSRLRIAVPAGQPILRADLEDEQPATSARLAAANGR